MEQYGAMIRLERFRAEIRASKMTDYLLFCVHIYDILICHLSTWKLMSLLYS